MVVILTIYFFIFMGCVEELFQFHAYLNSTNVNLKLSLDYSKSEIHFLDLKILKDEEGKIHTSIFSKSSDRNTILRADSFHPSHLISNIPMGQFQRLRRICDSDNDFEVQASSMTKRFKERGYSDRTLSDAYLRAKSANRQALLQKSSRSKKMGQIFLQ